MRLSQNQDYTIIYLCDHDQLEDVNSGPTLTQILLRSTRLASGTEEPGKPDEKWATGTKTRHP